jgi:hypothetical protein
MIKINDYTIGGPGDPSGPLIPSDLFSGTPGEGLWLETNSEGEAVLMCMFDPKDYEKHWLSPQTLNSKAKRMIRRFKRLYY